MLPKTPVLRGQLRYNQQKTRWDTVINFLRHNTTPSLQNKQEKHGRQCSLTPITTSGRRMSKESKVWRFEPLTHHHTHQLLFFAHRHGATKHTFPPRIRRDDDRMLLPRLLFAAAAASVEIEMEMLLCVAECTRAPHVSSIWERRFGSEKKLGSVRGQDGWTVQQMAGRYSSIYTRREEG